MPLSASSRARFARLALLLAPVASLFAAPALAADPFTLIVVPDTQNYTDFDNINTQYNIGQMNWIADQYKNNTSNLNVKFVMHMGDLQNPGNPYRARTDNIYEPDTSQPLGDVADKNAKWNRADAGIDVLDANNVPYSLVPGNHDYLDHNTKSEPWKYLKMFGPQRLANEQATWAASKRTYVGASPANPNNGYAGMDTYHRFDAGGYKFLNIALQYAPDDADLKWAQQIINENPGLPTIITTHSYVNTVSQENSGNPYQQDAIFDKLVKNNPQIVMTFNGHLTGANYVAGTNIAGKTVHQMLFDAQASDLDAQLADPGKSLYRGGGVLRLAQFEPDKNRVLINDYSPIANKYLPSDFTAPDRDGSGSGRYLTPSSLSLDLDAQFGLPNKAGIVKSTSFRQGVNGYNSTGDTYIDEGDGAANFGSLDTVWVDGDTNNSGTGSPDAQAMIRFQSLFGSGAGQIPLGAQIESAELILHTSNRSNAESGNTFALYRLLKNWQETTAVWNTFNGFNADGIEAILMENGTVTPTARDGYVSFNVTESLAALSQGATNMGWVLRPLGGSDGWQFDSSEAVDVLDRPQLNVTFRAVPEPTAMAFFGLAALGLMRRARRM
jgi:hypothetical protein